MTKNTEPQGRPHIFVIRGDLLRVAADAVLIPTDTDLRVETYWCTPGGLQPGQPVEFLCVPKCQVQQDQVEGLFFDPGKRLGQAAGVVRCRAIRKCRAQRCFERVTEQWVIVHDQDGRNQSHSLCLPGAADFLIRSLRLVGRTIPRRKGMSRSIRLLS